MALLCFILHSHSILFSSITLFLLPSVANVQANTQAHTLYEGGHVKGVLGFSCLINSLFAYGICQKKTMMNEKNSSRPQHI